MLCNATGESVENFEINKLGDIEIIRFDCAVYLGCRYLQKETHDALLQSSPLESIENSSCGVGKLGETVCVTRNGAALNRVKIRNQVVKFNWPHLPNFAITPTLVFQVALRQLNQNVRPNSY